MYSEKNLENNCMRVCQIKISHFLKLNQRKIYKSDKYLIFGMIAQIRVANRNTKKNKYNR